MDVEYRVPDLPMPRGREQARYHALVGQIATGQSRRTVRGYWKPVTLAVSGGLLAAVVIVGSQRTTPTSLAASWSPRPSPLDASAAAEAGQVCLRGLAAQDWPIGVSDMTTVLAERRGKLTAVLLDGDQQYGMCVGDPQDPVFRGVATVGAFDPATKLLLDGCPGQLNARGAFRLAYGQVSADVARVDIEVADGTRVDATVADGRFFAWWPSGTDPRTITARARDGHVLRALTPTLPSRTVVPTRRPTTR